MKPQILCISFSDINVDSRVLRQVQVLSELGAVTTLAYGEIPAGASAHIEIDSSLPSLPQTPLGVFGLALRLYKTSEFSAPAVHQALQLANGENF